MDVPLVNGDTGLVTGLTLFIELPVGGGIVPSYTLRTARLFRLSLRSHPPPRSHTHTRARAGSLVATRSDRCGLRDFGSGRRYEGTRGKARAATEALLLALVVWLVLAEAVRAAHAGVSVG